MSMRSVAFLVFLCCVVASCSAADCSTYQSCELCTSDTDCGWYSMTGKGSLAFTCERGDNFTCDTCSGTYVYFYDHCPTEFDKLVRSRRAVRKYVSDPLSKDIIEDIITDASWGPSAEDTEDSRYYVVTEPEIIKSISDYVKKQLNDTRPGDVVFYDAPAVVFLFEENACPGFGDVDGGIVLQSFLLSAYNHGLATCPIGYARAGEDYIRSTVGAPSSQSFIIGITLGHAAVGPTHGRKPPVIVYV